MGLLSDLGGGPVALDSSIFIYFIEAHPIYLPLVEPLFEAIDTGALEAVTSSLTLLEVLVIPFRLANAGLIHRYEVILTSDPESRSAARRPRSEFSPRRRPCPGLHPCQGSRRDAVGRRDGGRLFSLSHQ